MFNNVRPALLVAVKSIRKTLAANCIVFVLIGAVVLPSSAHAEDNWEPGKLSIVKGDCLIAASEAFGVPLPVLFGILKTEGGKVGMESRNKNNTYDLGPMQVNDGVWVSKLAQIQNISPQMVRIMLRDHGCYNIVVGAWIFKQQQQATGDWKEAVGYYHSRTPILKQEYQRKFAQSLVTLFNLPTR